MQILNIYSYFQKKNVICLVFYKTRWTQD